VLPSSSRSRNHPTLKSLSQTTTHGDRRHQPTAIGGDDDHIDEEVDAWRVAVVGVEEVEGEGLARHKG
jgi:hypothetical protein